MRTILITVYLIVPLIGTIIALFSAFPVPPRQPLPRMVAEQQRRDDAWTAKQRAFAHERDSEKAQREANKQAEHQRHLERNRVLCAQYPLDFYLTADGDCEMWPSPPPATIIVVVPR